MTGTQFALCGGLSLLFLYVLCGVLHVACVWQLRDLELPSVHRIDTVTTTRSGAFPGCSHGRALQPPLPRSDGSLSGRLTDHDMT